MDAPHESLFSVLRKRLREIAQGCNELYCNNPESNILQNSSYAATYLPSEKKNIQIRQKKKHAEHS